MTYPGLTRICRCELSRTDNFIEALSLRQLAALPGHAELLITSQLLSGKDPQHCRVRHRSILPAEALTRLKEVLDEFLCTGSDGSDGCDQAAVQD